MTTLPLQPTTDSHPSAPDAADIASAQRVLTLRQQYPDKSADELVDLCIRTCCVHVASQSVATAGLAILPAFSRIGGLVVGALSNQVNTTQQRQVDLLLDIATIYGYRFRPNEKSVYLAIALGLALGNQPNQRPNSNQSATEELLAKGGQQLVHEATQRLARSTVGRVLPVVNATRAAGSHILMTHTASQRAKTYLKTGPDTVGALDQSISAALTREELKLAELIGQSLTAGKANVSDTLMEGFDQGAQQVGRAAGRAVRKLVNFSRNTMKPK